ncbi:bifunctional DNA-binding transcriptional regulator/O6-methylguanine-DNA methyltransferase Ada [Salinisphaera sp. Q1T1-3]|uniref:bifunctional DNA-binding transcriptional regulator/O6-methylguanine-DNA methyltransferase Ada n=1 Tax=Salinisphaera sp. Q1T1-3 TaxID=2321229 RepID=UPI000E726814|nr:bifunctional DNA-binding transcriptional regulator/O6-methylguanine-DNA methyltransferase Ada [Salinisphaera sp. Q1T1-3]RJS95207.1 bifunctional DNA-binding transcriptional regulator/O6-methylguanine-DNA methyltransferase Ada [Salinisphaera sp. Q1T1-3]
MDDTCDDRRWQAVLTNDDGADGIFVYAVATTGIYCRPSCRSRPPRPENVRFFNDAAAARAAGYRACKRCRPDRDRARDPRMARITQACRLIEASDKSPRLVDLARRLGMSRYHLHRLFKQTVGITPRQYAIACRDHRVRAALAGGKRVIDAQVAAGFESSGHFHAAAGRSLGMSASAYRRQGDDQTIRFAVGQSRLGAILVAGATRGVCAITIGDDPDALVQALQDRFARAKLVGDDAEFARHVARVVGFIETPARGLDLPLDIRGTVFQQRVWQALQAIPCGEQTSYAEIAERIGAPGAARAVAGACAANPIAIAIPCHRVVRTDGTMSGYRWGIARKRALLALEAEAGDATDHTANGCVPER